MKAVQISKPGGNFEVVDRPIPQPARGQVGIKVEACGICHSDALIKEGHWPGIQYPRVPGTPDFPQSRVDRAVSGSFRIILIQ